MKRLTLAFCLLSMLSCKSRTAQLNEGKASSSEPYTLNDKPIDANQAQKILDKRDKHCDPPTIKPSTGKVEIPLRDIFILSNDKNAVVKGLLSPSYWQDAKDPKTQRPLLEKATDGVLKQEPWPGSASPDVKMREFLVQLGLGGLLGHVDLPLQLYVNDLAEQIRVRGYNSEEVVKLFKTVIGEAQLSVIGKQRFDVNFDLAPLKHGKLLQGYLMNGSISLQLQGPAGYVPAQVIETYARTLWSVFVLAVSSISGRECQTAQSRNASP